MTPESHRILAAGSGLCSLLFLAAVGCATATEDSSPGPTGSAPVASDPPWFEEISAAAGIDFICESGHQDRLLFPEIMPGGVALFDLEGDGDLDIYLVQAGSFIEPGTPRSRT